MLGDRAAGDLLRVGERAAFHLGQDALLVQLGLEKAGVAVELHQVEDLRAQAARVSLRSSGLARGPGEALLCYVRARPGVMPVTATPL